jgi:signal peptidase I
VTLRDKLAAEAKSWMRAAAVALAIWLVLRSYIVEAFRIPSPSMENTLLVGDFLFVDKTGYGGQFQIPFTGIRFGRLPGYAEPKRDGIVIFRSAEDSTPNLDVVKRLIGVPGDTLQMVNDTLIRNGVRLEEPYALHLAGGVDATSPQIQEQMRARQLPYYVGNDATAYRPTPHNWGPIVVPPDHYWVMGDNRDSSWDSRFWGFLPRSHIEGRPLIIYMSVALDPFRVRWNRLLRHPG